MSAEELARAISTMHSLRRYNRLLLILDTCQAATMYRHIEAPNVIAIASSLLGESSYSVPKPCLTLKHPLHALFVMECSMRWMELSEWL